MLVIIMNIISEAHQFKSYMYDYINCLLIHVHVLHPRPHSSTLGKAEDTEIFRNMDSFEKVTTVPLTICV